MLQKLPNVFHNPFFIKIFQIHLYRTKSYAAIWHELYLQTVLQLNCAKTEVLIATYCTLHTNKSYLCVPASHIYIAPEKSLLHFNSPVLMEQGTNKYLS